MNKCTIHIASTFRPHDKTWCSQQLGRSSDRGNYHSVTQPHALRNLIEVMGTPELPESPYKRRYRTCLGTVGRAVLSLQAW